MKTTLNINSLYKQFPGICAVDMLSFEAKSGEIIALLGPNGAGKSTLMNMLAGILAPDGGSILIQGEDIKKNPLKAKQMIGFLAEGAPLYSDMKVCSFLSYIADLKGLAKVEKKKRLEEIKDLAKIHDVWNNKIETLSKGYQRRVGFAQSLIADPDILLLDEPTDGLDPNQKEHIRKLIKQLGKHKIILISTHLLDDVEQMCNRILVMNHGCIIADGTKEELIAQTKAFTLENAFRKLTGGSYV